MSLGTAFSGEDLLHPDLICNGKVSTKGDSASVPDAVQGKDRLHGLALCPWATSLLLCCASNRVKVHYFHTSYALIYALLSHLNILPEV